MDLGENTPENQENPYSMPGGRGVHLYYNAVRGDDVLMASEFKVSNRERSLVQGLCPPPPDGSRERCCGEKGEKNFANRKRDIWVQRLQPCRTREKDRRTKGGRRGPTGARSLITIIPTEVGIQTPLPCVPRGFRPPSQLT